VVTSADLRRRARAHGIATSWTAGGQHHQVPTSTLEAVLDALTATDRRASVTHGRPSKGIGDSPMPFAAGGPGARAPMPAGRRWGFTVQLYSLRSRDSWGFGDLRDLADFATWAARDLGASFVLVNPLHAAEPVAPVTASPYTPMSRRFLSPLYLRIEDIPEAGPVTNPLRDANTVPGLIDRDAVWTAKQAALEAIFRVPLSPQRQRELDAFRVREGRRLTGWATWCAIAEVHGRDYRTWPLHLRDPEGAEVSTFRFAHADRVAFHEWLQWLMAEQAASAQAAAREAGMEIGIVHDLAVGAFPGGFDAWAGRDTLVADLSVGAPPDEFNQLGQDWALPPWNPSGLAEQAYQPLADLFAAVARDAGGLRVDHVLGLSRLWVIPHGLTPDKGTYLRFDRNATLSVLAEAAQTAGALAVGEDLGTVEHGLRGALAARRILGTSMLWFERRADGSPLPPAQWRRESLATVSTHDMPPSASFLSGDHVAQRAALGLLTRPEAVERAEAAAAIDAWTAALRREGLLTGSDPGSFTAALYGYLARTPALLIGVSLADAVGDVRPQNIPGTTDEYPNWRLPLCDGNGKPVLIEDLPFNTSLRAVAASAAANPESLCPPRPPR
jgi:4-alpha-glucanotransferase